MTCGDDDRRQRPRVAARWRAVLIQHPAAHTEFTLTEVVAMGRAPHLGLFDRVDMTTWTCGRSRTCSR